MSRLLPAIAVALCGLGTIADAQRFVAKAEAVRVDVLVMDGKKAVRGLMADDFEVRDGGVLQAVRQMEIERLPLNLICVFDSSGSMVGTPLRNLLDAGRSLVSGLQARDRIALLSFASRVRLQSPLTGDRTTVLRGLDAIEANGMTSLRDAAFAGLALREADPGRTLLLLFSDGADTSSWLPAAKVLEAAKRTDVVVYPVSLAERPVTLTSGNVPIVIAGTMQNPGMQTMTSMQTTVITRTPSSRFLDDLADETGGRVLRVESDKDLQATFVATLAEFRDRYMLTYVPAGVPSSGWHPLTVRLKGRRGTVTARRGYFAE